MELPNFFPFIFTGADPTGASQTAQRSGSQNRREMRWLTQSAQGCAD